MTTLAIKQYAAEEISDFVDLAWADIAIRHGGNVPRVLAVAGAARNDDRTFFCLRLAECSANRGHRVILVDLDKTAVRFRKKLDHNAIRGFADFCNSLFDEPFLSRHIDDYGFNDLMNLIALKRRTGKIVFRHENLPAVTLELSRGVPVRMIREGMDTDDTVLDRLAVDKNTERASWTVKLAKTAALPLPLLEKLARADIAPADELALLHEDVMARALAEVRAQGYVTFDLVDSKGAHTPLPETLRRVSPACGIKPERDGFMRSLLDRLTIRTKQGFAFMPLGHFPLREKDFTERAPKVFRLLSAIYDQIILNLPVFDGGIARQAAKLADGVVLAIKSSSIERRTLAKTLASFRADGVILIGAILTDAPPEAVARA